MSRSLKTIETNSIKYMLKFVDGYELVKAKKHPQFAFARDFFAANEICFQNFYKFYKRFIVHDRDPEKLLPIRRGPKPKYLESPLVKEGSLEAVILSYRQKGLNKFAISHCLKAQNHLKKTCSASTVYRILKAHGVSRLTKTVTEPKRKIVKEKPGELLHVDCHFLPKGVVRSSPTQRYYALGVIDDYSRVVWVEIMKSTKSLDATFAMMDAMLILNQRYGLQAQAVMTDNGAEFCSPRVETHPFERLLQHFAIKHLRTRPYRPQTNGKIERFWRSFHDEVIAGSVFETLDALKDAVMGYNLFFNEHRPHQGIDGRKPINMLGLEESQMKS